MNPTPFEKANDFGSNIAASLALHHTLNDLAKAKEETSDDPETANQISIGEEILFQALITLAGDDIAEA